METEKTFIRAQKTSKGITTEIRGSLGNLLFLLFTSAKAIGEKIDLTDVEVKVEVSLKKIEISDDEEKGGAVGNIFAIIYKGDHYQVTVRTEENEEDSVFDTENTWNVNDRVSVIIKPEDIKLTLKQEIKK